MARASQARVRNMDSGSAPDLLNQGLPLNQVLRGWAHPLELEKLGPHGRSDP